MESLASILPGENNTFLKTFNDPVHGTILVDPLCSKIIDTPEFQRLRHIRQCGICYLVYPSANHSRFEHSIGVYHLAGLMLDNLKVEVSSEDKLCVRIAALCHDLGHGPFSHLWEQFINNQNKNSKKWHHEDMSLKIFEELVSRNKLEDEFKKYKLTYDHMEQIKNIISGKYEKIEKEKLFLFEIVANKKTNIDVDRWDYMLRDAYFFGVICPIDFTRIITDIRVKVTESGEHRIAFRDKLKENILEIFKFRMKLHRICYKHRVCKKLEIMLIDALALADDHFFEDGMKLSNCHEDIQKYLSLNDSLINTILYSNKMTRAKDILHRILTRDLYPNLFLVKLSSSLPKEKIKTLESKLPEIEQLIESKFGTAVRLGLIDINMGIEGEDPFEDVIFFSKRTQNLHQHDDCISIRQLSLFVCSVNIIPKEETQMEIEAEIKRELTDYA